MSKALITFPRVAHENLRFSPGRPLFHLRAPSCKIFQRVSIERRSEIVPSLSGALFRVALTHIDSAGPTSAFGVFEKSKSVCGCGKCA